MKKNSVLRKVLAVALSAVTLLSTGFTAVGSYVGTSGISVSAAVYGDFEYEVNEDNTVTIKKYTGSGGDVVIPGTIDSKIVTSMGNKLFYGCVGLKSIIIPDSVASVGEWTFWSCTNLKSITIGNNVVYIGDCAFMGCTSLTSIAIPDSVTFIGSQAFQNCTGLSDIIFSDSITSINKRTFVNCTNLTSITIPDSVTSIGNFAFDGCTGLKNITIPDSVTSIGYYVFESCNNLTISGTADSYVQTYAGENNIPFTTVLKNTSTISADETVLGQIITVNANASGGSGDYQYAVLYKKKNDTKWVVKQNYSTNANISVKPSKADDYDICVKVKDGNGNIKKKFFTVIVKAPKLINQSTISKTTIRQGKTVTVKGLATGGMGGYTYAVYYKKKTETKWTTRQDYKENSEILVRPYTNADYDICIKVKDKNGDIAKKYFTVTVTK